MQYLGHMMRIRDAVRPEQNMHTNFIAVVAAGVRRVSNICAFIEG